MSGLAADNILILQDGRSLGYAEYGDPGGWPLLFFHGTPGSRVMARLAAGEAAALSVRLIAPERPGFGRSEAKGHRRLLDWPRDVEELADALHLDQFAVVGVSGGGPYAAACAWALPGRVKVAGLVSSLAPVDVLWRHLPWHRRLLARLAQRPFLTGPVLALLAAVVRQRPQVLRACLSLAARGDATGTLARPEVRRLQLDGIREALRPGAAGLAGEMALLSRPWGFALEEITAPVFLWHGQKDAIVPVAMGQHLAEHIPRCRARFIAGAGHLWIFDGFGEVLRLLRDEAQVQKAS